MDPYSSKKFLQNGKFQKLLMIPYYIQSIVQILMVMAMDINVEFQMTP